MKTIEVVAAVIKHNDRLFITRRGYGDFVDMWEFPGGKIEIGESKEEALIREIKEELSEFPSYYALFYLPNFWWEIKSKCS